MSSTRMTAITAQIPRKERRSRGRIPISVPVRVRPADPKLEEEVRTSLNASRDGLYFTTWARHYHVGMKIGVTFPYSSVDVCNLEYSGEVARIEQLIDGRLGIAVRILLRCYFQKPNG